ncbi:MAG: alpha-amylase/4-alpha-glucanotransferase domain-containing protein, partial [Sulfuriferula sp.]
HHNTLGDNAGAAHQGDGISSAHDRISFKHVVTQDDLAYDQVGRSMFRDALHVDGGVVGLNYVLQECSGDILDFIAETSAGALHKRIAILNGQLQVIYTFPQGLQGQFITEINLAMPSCDGPAGRFVLGDQVVGGFGQPQIVEAMDHIRLEDEVLKGSIALSANQPVKFASQPLFTVSQSEAGFEKIMQAVTLQLDWQLPTGENQLELNLIVNPV